jgi:hypothetical protein
MQTVYFSQSTTIQQQQQQQQHSFPSLSNKQAEIEAQIKADEELAKSLALAMQLEDQDQQRRQQQQAQPTSDNSNSGSGSSDDGPGFQDQIKSKLEVMGKVTKVKFSDLMNGFKRRISGSNNSGSGGDRYSSLEADEATVILPKGERYQVSNSASQQDGNDITHHNYAHTTNGSSSAGKSDRSRQPSDRSMVTVKLSEPNYPRVLSAKNGVSPVNTGKTKLVLPDLIEFGDEEPAAEMLGGNQNSFMATTGSSSTHSTQQLLSGGVATPRAYVQPTIVSPFANGRTSTDFPQQQQSDPTATINDWTLFSSK